MKRTIPLFITAIAGFVLIVAVFVPAWEDSGEAAAIWFDILAAIAFILGGGNLIKLQLQRMSDRKPGWGYSAVTLVSFLAMLSMGLLKVGCPPELSTEFYGETFVPFAISDLPEYRIAGIIPTRADGEELPKSVRLQIRQDGNDVVFSGWMTAGQRADLQKWRNQIDWQCLVEQLYTQSQPPALFEGKLRYDPDHQALAFTGWMSPAMELELQALLPAGPAAEQAIARMATEARQPTTIDASRRPTGFAIPQSAADFVSLNGDELQVLGPVTSSLRDDLARTWADLEPARPLTPGQQQDLQAEIGDRGAALTADQLEAFNAFFEADWKAAELVQMLNTAGAQPATSRAKCEILTDVEAGNLQPIAENEAPEPVTLNPEQEQVVESFVTNPAMTREELLTQLQSAGEFLPAQATALEQFFLRLPTAAAQRQKLAFALIRRGPLTSEQIEFLTSAARAEFQWRQDVGRLFLAAHETKYSWSGSYSAQGSPFWWLYEYVMQPLMTTTFALLAFYVASAAFRAFRAKNIEAVLLLGTAFIILLGRTFAGYLLTSWVPESLGVFRIDQLTVYIMSILNTAGNRAIMIGIALGIVSTSLKVLLGVDRSYLGRGDD